jgi:O-antigen ligase
VSLSLALYTASKRNQYIIILSTTLAVFLLFSYKSTGSAAVENKFISRALSLFDLKKIKDAEAVRIALYHKAGRLISQHPIAGCGIGGFYMNSVNYGKDGDAYGGPDPRALTPDFAHNFILQFAAELGIPATLLFCSLIGAAWYKGFRHARAALKGKNGGRVSLALFLALTTYLITQMTANSLNIYVSHQFFFWFLIAALLTLPDSKTENRPNAIG